MREVRHSIIASLVVALAAAPCLALDDNITLTVDRGGVPDEVDLEWSGGTSPYRVFRSETAFGIGLGENLLVETPSTFWTDAPPAGEIFFYRVTGIPTAFRVTDINLLDPHVFALVAGFLCTDVTNLAFNQQVEDLINSDSDGDGLLDFSTLVVFRPLDPASASGIADLGTGDCTAPVGTTACFENPAAPPTPTSYANLTTGTCLAPFAGTTSGYSPPVTPTIAPPTCLVTDDVTLGLSFGGATIPLEDAQLSANYAGDPADSLVNGLMRGFLAESVADTVLVDTGTFGIVPISSLLRGGAGNCASGDDKDIGLDGLTLGWWIYFDFSASEVSYNGL